MSTTGQPTRITLPVLEYGPIKESIGEIRHVLDIGGTREIISSVDYKTSQRVIEKKYVLADGQTIIVTKKSALQLPIGVDGILHRNGQGQLKWIAHTKLVAFEQTVLQHGLDQASAQIADSWNGSFTFRTEKQDAAGNVTEPGLRPPQIGGLHAIGAHWSLSQQPATVVMPTGTGKTETMLATLVAYRPGRILVVVPSRVLRDQTARKFTVFGLLRNLGNLSVTTQNPVVGIVSRRPQVPTDVEIFKKCNVVISTMSALSDTSTGAMAQLVADQIDTLVVDEAHHIAATGWAAFREKFKKKRVIQFTATP